MRRVLRVLGAAVAVALSATSCSAGPGGPSEKPAAAGEVVYHPDYPFYRSQKDMFAKAALVIEGKVTDQARTESMTPTAPDDPTDPRQNPQAGAPAAAAAAAPAEEPMVITVRTVEVVRVFKGAVRVGDTIEVKELGGRLNGVTYREEEATPLQQEKTYALFLETYPDAPASLLSSRQGKYLAGASDGYSAMPGNQITVTRKELEKLKNSD
jgi:hypothetical protein